MNENYVFKSKIPNGLWHRKINPDVMAGESQSQSNPFDSE